MNNYRQFYKEAEPIWLKGLSKELNICMDTVFEGTYKNLFLLIAGSTYYQVFVNKKLIHYGPERRAKNCFSIDRVSVPDLCDDDKITVRCIGYNCRSFSNVNQNSFLIAELISEDKVVAATGKKEFKYYNNIMHEKDVVRYSSQRNFSEVWDYRKIMKEYEIERTSVDGEFAMRKTPYSEYTELQAERAEVLRYKTVDELSGPIFEYLINPPKNFDHFNYDKIKEKPLEFYLRTRIDKNGKMELERWKFNSIQAGFLNIEAEVYEDAELIIVFAEQLDKNERPNLKCLDSSNIIKYYLPKGKHTVCSLEPYTEMYCEILHIKGSFDIKSVKVSELAFPEKQIKPVKIDNPEIELIYKAAIKTFRHNAVDLFMDCPSRERAGWLFDSFYTARAEFELTGASKIEDSFLRNFLDGGIYSGKGGVTEMCYPSEVYSNNFIPQWSMWYVLEVYEYTELRKGSIAKDKFKKQIYDLIDYFKSYENEYGLLERLGGWNFVEWSKLNTRVQDVSWPTNMLYSKMLKKIGELYNDDELLRKSELLRQVITDMSFDGKLFHDRAIRKDGVLKNTDEFSETAQYYSIYFGIADNTDKFRTIFDILYGRCKIDELSDYTEIEPSDAIPGIYMRLDLLVNFKKYDLATKYIKKYFLDMARTTGTLWERKSGITSRDHGFAAFVAVLIRKIIKNNNNIQFERVVNYE